MTETPRGAHISEGRLTPKQARYCYHRHAGLSQRAAYRKAYDAENMAAATIDVKACQLEAEDKVAGRLDELRQQAIDALHAGPDFVINRLRQEALPHDEGGAKEGSARVAALGQLVKINGISYADKSPITDMTGDEIAAEIQEACREHLEALDPAALEILLRAALEAKAEQDQPRVH